MPRAPPAALNAELGYSGVSRPPCPPAPALSLEQQVKQERRQCTPSPPRGPLDLSLCTPHPAVTSSLRPLPPVALGPRSSPSLAAAVCCHCDVTKGQPSGTFPFSVMSKVGREVPGAA